jgi:prepilin-type N-terminal cleavage/methylation domain-containing protein/prepilin-type processing-associated H-X9-DG protein
MKAQLPKRRGFTLVELLVVMGIIAVLVAILIPAITAVREQGQRTVCASRLKQIVAGVHMYATEFRGKLPSGARDFDGGEHCVWISQNTYECLARFSGYNLSKPQPPPLNSIGDPWLTCPNLQDPTPRPQYGWPYGWVIGYDYLAGHPGVNAWQAANPVPAGMVKWTSPLKVNESAKRVVIADWIGRDITGGSWVSIPHRKGGATGFLIPPASVTNRTPKALGATGGNVGYLDGSVAWTPVDDLREHVDSQWGPQYTSWW